MRERLPDRRPSWTIQVHINGKSYFLTMGEYPDGRLGEIWLETEKEGVFTRGVLGALSRSVSLALQSKAPVEDMVRALRGLNFPPNGPVAGSKVVTECTSVPDWAAQEIEAAYLKPPPPEKMAGHISTSSGV